MIEKAEQEKIKESGSMGGSLGRLMGRTGQKVAPTDDSSSLASSLTTGLGNAMKGVMPMSPKPNKEGDQDCKQS